MKRPNCIPGLRSAWLRRHFSRTAEVTLGRLRRSIGRVPPTPKHGRRGGSRRQAMVATDEGWSRAGVEILKRGGNAVDTAVAVLCISVVEPAAGILWRRVHVSAIANGGKLLITAGRRRVRRRATCTSKPMKLDEEALGDWVQVGGGAGNRGWAGTGGEPTGK